MALRLRNAGRWNGGTPQFGKIAVRADDGKGWVIVDDPEYIHIRERIVQDARDGKSLNAITEWLNAEGIPAPCDVIRIRYGKPPRGTGWKLPSVRLIAEADGVKIPPRPRERGTRPARMLTRVAFCELCGGRLYGRANLGYKYYYCTNITSNRGAKPMCRAPSMRADHLEAKVDRYMRVAGSGVRYRELVWVPGDDGSRKLAQIDKRIAELDQDADDYDERHAELRAARKRVKAEGVTMGYYDRRDTGKTVAQHWDSLDDAGRRQFMLTQGIWIKAHKDGRRINKDGGGIVVKITGVRPMGEETVWEEVRS